jgi:hypothetical protein
MLFYIRQNHVILTGFLSESGCRMPLYNRLHETGPAGRQQQQMGDTGRGFPARHQPDCERGDYSPSVTWP